MSVLEESPLIAGMLVDTLRDIGIPPCPAILNRINVEMGREEPDFNQVASVIASDVGLAAGLISLANSPYYGLRKRVRSVNEALMMLGLSSTSRAIAGLVLHKIFPATPTLTRFWSASARIAMLSGWLAQRLEGCRVNPEDAYSFGLFRDAGIAVLINRFPEYIDLLSRANEESPLSFTAVEEAALPTNHAVVGCLLAQGWWLPEEICLAIRFHHEYPPSAPQNKTILSLIAISQLSEHLLQYHTCLSKTGEWVKAQAFCLEQLDLTVQGLESLYRASEPIVAI